MRPCRICGNMRKNQLNRHHLLPKHIRDRGTRQITIKLCAEKNGCRTHLSFHEGCRKAANRIRLALTDEEIGWMVNQAGSKWVRETYPPRLR